MLLIKTKNARSPINQKITGQVDRIEMRGSITFGQEGLTHLKKKIFPFTHKWLDMEIGFHAEFNENLDKIEVNRRLEMKVSIKFGQRSLSI